MALRVKKNWSDDSYEATPNSVYVRNYTREHVWILAITAHNLLCLSSMLTFSVIYVVNSSKQIYINMCVVIPFSLSERLLGVYTFFFWWRIVPLLISYYTATFNIFYFWQLLSVGINTDQPETNDLTHIQSISTRWKAYTKTSVITTRTIFVHWKLKAASTECSSVCQWCGVKFEMSKIVRVYVCVAFGHGLSYIISAKICVQNKALASEWATYTLNKKSQTIQKDLKGARGVCASLNALDRIKIKQRRLFVLHLFIWREQMLIVNFTQFNRWEIHP